MPVVNVCSPVFYKADSYGRIACELSAVLELRGYHVNQIGTDAPDGVIRPSFGGIHLGYPTKFEYFGEMANIGSRIAVTMFESSKLPPNWAAILNTYQAVVVPAEFLVEVFRQSGVIVPLHVIPLGISEAFKQAAPRPASPLTVIVIADQGSRKNWLHAIYGFVRAFGEDTNYRLIVKARKDSFEGMIRSIANKNIDLIEDDLSDDQLRELYHQCHIMLSPARAEGFGFLPREFAATGGISLATNWGGLADDIDKWGVPLTEFTMQPAFKEEKQHLQKWGDADLGCWADVDINHIKERLLDIAANQAGYLKGAAEVAAPFVHRHYCWSTFGERIADLWEAL